MAKISIQFRRACFAIDLTLRRAVKIDEASADIIFFSMFFYPRVVQRQRHTAFIVLLATLMTIGSFAMSSLNLLGTEILSAAISTSTSSTTTTTTTAAASTMVISGFGNITNVNMNTLSSNLINTVTITMGRLMPVLRQRYVSYSHRFISTIGKLQRQLRKWAVS